MFQVFMFFGIGMGLEKIDRINEKKHKKESKKKINENDDKWWKMTDR